MRLPPTRSRAWTTTAVSVAVVSTLASSTNSSIPVATCAILLQFAIFRNRCQTQPYPSSLIVRVTASFSPTCKSPIPNQTCLGVLVQSSTVPLVQSLGLTSNTCASLHTSPSHDVCSPSSGYPTQPHRKTNSAHPTVRLAAVVLAMCATITSVRVSTTLIASTPRRTTARLRSRPLRTTGCLAPRSETGTCNS